ncbi:DNA cytosine methyltransferase, partial [Streptomyces sp. x-80]|uniref:DNA cytosine methyltransferase n=1 Tax=Streptomyces sp. x-80 TaxID=2789282 RepID=UPI00397F7FB6
MPILELCSGYGGLGLAVEALTGERVRYVAEIDPHASQILAARYPDAPNLGDVQAINWAALIGEIDIVTAGFPCQGISNAGRRGGLSDARSAIWFNVLDAVRVLRPDFVFLENVAAIRTRGLAEVLAGLAESGYDAKWISLRASEIGAPHHRDRWFCVAVPADANGESRFEWRSPTPPETTEEDRICGGGGGGGEGAPAPPAPSPSAPFVTLPSATPRRSLPWSAPSYCPPSMPRS